MFSGDIERDQWHEMSYEDKKKLLADLGKFRMI